MSYADIYTAIKGTCVQAGRHNQDVSVGLFWSNTNPAEIVLSITQDTDVVVWTVARTNLVAAFIPTLRGAWTGGGAFATVHDGETLRFAFKPLGSDRRTWAFVRVPARAVEQFIAHSERIVPSCGDTESAITLGMVDRALAEIFA